MASGTISTGSKADVQAIGNILGAKNLLPNGATSKTIDGVEFIVNKDGSITVNGTATEALSFDIFDVNHPDFEYIVKNIFLGKQLILSGCPAGGSRDTYSINIYRVGSVDGSDATILERGDGVEFTWLNNLSGVLPVVEIVIRKNVTIDNLTFYPMIRPASISDPTYVPYAMTNRELTERLIYDEQQVTISDVPSKDWNYGTISYNLPSGYKIGSVTLKCSTGACIACISAITSASMIVYARNMGNVSTNVTVTAIILYIKG